MLIFFSIMINAAKNKCSDVSIFKGKARNVDYMSSCKLRVLERFFFLVYKYVWTGEAMAVNTPRAILDFGDLPPPGFGISAFNLFHFRVNLAQTVALPISPRYICMNNTNFPMN